MNYQDMLFSISVYSNCILWLWHSMVMALGFLHIQFKCNSLPIIHQFELIIEFCFRIKREQEKN